MEVPGALEIARLFWRRKLWLVIPTLVGASLGFLYLKSEEPRYRATALLSVYEQAIRRDFVEETVTAGVSDRLRQIELLIKQAAVL